MKTVQPNSFSKTPIAIRVNLLQFGPSMPSFVFAVLFKPIAVVNVLSSYFNLCFAEFGGQILEAELTKFHDTAPLFEPSKERGFFYPRI